MSMVKFMKSWSKQPKVEITRWLYLNWIPFNVSTSPKFWAIHKNHYDKYTVIGPIKFNNNIAHGYQ